MEDNRTASQKTVSPNASKRIFIAGTDTDAGKTIVAASLLCALRNAGFSTAALKPVAAGGAMVTNEYGQQEMQNDDAILLRQMATHKATYAKVNPLCFKRPIAPHIAAFEESSALSVDVCLSACQASLQAPVDFMIIEGAGGWLVPLNHSEAMSDLAHALHAGVILVVGVKLGCLNHAMLTYQSIQASGSQIIGWVANHLESQTSVSAANVDYLKRQFDMPLLGQLDFQGKRDYELWAKQLNIDVLTSTLN